MHLVKASQITIAANRQRKEIDQAELMELSNSIVSVGLIHPIVVNFELASDQITLVAGERRMKAIDTIWAMGNSFSHEGMTIPEGHIPCTYLKDLDPIDAMEIELEENIRRTDISWQDRCEATAKLFEFRERQAAKAGRPPPSVGDISLEVRGSSKGSSREDTRQEIIMSRYLSDPDVASAKTVEEGFKIIRRKEEATRSAALGESVGRTFSSSDHRLHQGSCLNIMSNMGSNFYDVILTDPPYGIGAQDFNDSGGKANAAGHIYDDSYDSWVSLVNLLAPEFYRLAKPQSHLYCFCDSDNFLHLRGLMAAAGWKCFRTPFIWHNPTSQRAPWPQHGPHRRYQMCLYAVKGDRPVLKLAPDVVTYASDENLGWAAQKPVGLFADFLARSCRAGDSVLDPFCGSGTVFPAAHGMKVKATGIEMDPTAYGIAVKRLGELK